MTQARKRECPECRGPMYRIRLIDKAHYSAHMDFEYTVPEAERSFWMGHYPVEGKVAAFMCDDCGRLALYGMPYNADEPGGGG